MSILTIYQFYYTTYDIVDHDEDGAVYADVRNTLGAFQDFKTGLEYYKNMYPNKSIQYEIIQVLDIFED